MISSEMRRRSSTGSRHGGSVSVLLLRATISSLGHSHLHTECHSRCSLLPLWRARTVSSCWASVPGFPGAAALGPRFGKLALDTLKF